MTYWLVAREHSCVNHKPEEIPTEAGQRDRLGFHLGDLVRQRFLERGVLSCREEES